MIAALFSALHLLVLGIGLGSAFLRGRALPSRTFDKETDFYVHNGLFWVKARVALLARINDLEVALVVLMVFVAAMMARCLWLLT